MIGKPFLILSDGGANYYSKYMSDNMLDGLEEFKLMPNLIVGDLDSINEEVMKYFRKLQTAHNLNENTFKIVD